MNTKNQKTDSVEVTDAVEKSAVALREEAMLAFWREHDVFKKSLEAPAGQAPVGDFVFYDGPPFATGLPHYGHILASTIKDAIPRFWTMQGYHVRRQWGWDCHGLPLENLIEKKLGLATKRDIEEYGIKNFNEAAREAVMEFADDWRQIIPRMGRFADMDNDYKTMDSTYTESVWWVFKSLYEKGLVFEGFKSMHLCPRCGTTLSNFEVNLGYKDIKDIAVTVKLPLLDDAGQPTDTSLLVWTTTPWTLPGNLAAAVHEEFEYVKVRLVDTGDCVIVAKGRLAQLGDLAYEEVETMQGADLVGKKYEPPFAYLKNQLVEGQDKAFTIYHADYVELGEEGTGAVHIAPAYGEEDMELAKREGVPIVHHVDADGHFKDFVTEFAGQLVKPKDDDAAGIDHKDADIEVLKALQATGKIFKKENITHSYPHCWRCDTPLLNYATNSWFVNVPKIKDELVKANEGVHWVPEHVGKNRFGKWLEGARDWAVSRQRYWGAPIPIWRHPETKEFVVFGSLAELQAHTPKSGNEYFMMRHGESESNVGGIISANKENDDKVTETGQEQVRRAAAAVPEDVDIIVHSGFARTRQTAELVAAARPHAEVIEDDRIKELDVADELEGKSWSEYIALFPTWNDRYTKMIEGVENRRQVQQRMGAFLYDLETKYQGKKILIVSHAGPLFALECAAWGYDIKQAEEYFKQEGTYLQNAEFRALPFTPIPHNDNFELDYHRPYIDDFVVEQDGVRLERVSDVFDCWFESGSMPYGQYHYPFACADNFDTKLFPANFIAEGLDQTRGWFYSLIVLGVALFGKSPYENVIVNGLALAEDGKKMSKSLQNYPDPMDVANTAGADAMRFYLLSAPIVRGEDLNFSEQGVIELQRKNIGRLHNVLAMYEQYADGTESRSDSAHILDRWIVSRLNQLITEVTAGYKSYELDKATRPITDFIDDLSVWYLRRSRDRLKGEDVADKEATLATLRYVLEQLALTMAPAMPFYAEYLWQQVKPAGGAESVHLAAWPAPSTVNDELVTEMQIARNFVSVALELRVRAGVKVRQPLPILRIGGSKFKEEALYGIIADEVNVKKVVANEKTDLDTTITPELKQEGDAREFIRGVQDLRKKAGLEPSDRIVLMVQTSDSGEAVIRAFQSDIQKTVGATEIVFGDASGAELKAGEHQFTVELKRM